MFNFDKRITELLKEFTESFPVEGHAPTWQKKAGKSPSGGLNRKGIMSYRHSHPGSHLSMAVTTKPSKLKPGSKAAKRRKSFCARMKGAGSHLSMAVTTKPSKLKPGSKAAKRRKSFCARMKGVKGPMKKPNGKPTRKALALRKWNCHE